MKLCAPAILLSPRHLLGFSVRSVLHIFWVFQWDPCCPSSGFFGGIRVAHLLGFSVGSVLPIFWVFRWDPCCPSSVFSVLYFWFMCLFCVLYPMFPMFLDCPFLNVPTIFLLKFMYDVSSCTTSSLVS